MRYIIALIACSFLLIQCKKPDIEVQPTGSYDTLGIKWMTIEREHITYYFQGTGVNGASVYTDLHEETYIKLDEIFHAKLPRKLRYFVWMDWQLGEQLLEMPPGEATGFAVYEVCESHVRGDVPVGHEIAHILSCWANDTSGSTYAKFISEGIAVAFDFEGNNKLEAAKNAIKNKNMHSITEIWFDNEYDSKILYPVGGAFVEFLYKKNDNEKFFALVKNQTIEDAERIHGKEQSHALIKEFDALLGL